MFYLQRSDRATSTENTLCLCRRLLALAILYQDRKTIKRKNENWKKILISFSMECEYVHNYTSRIIQIIIHTKKRSSLLDNCKYSLTQTVARNRYSIAIELAIGATLFSNSVRNGGTLSHRGLRIKSFVP